MRAVTVCALAALLVASSSAAPEFVGEFESFKAKFGRRYASDAEEARRFKIFAENMRKARELQLVNPKAKFGVNEFADMSEAEFKKRHNGEAAYAKAQRAPLETVTVSQEQVKAAAGQSQDWRQHGAVTPVKNQGQCGSCWSFSTTGGIEGQWFLAGNTLTSLSEQELVSCDTIDHGCDGGLMDNAFTWLLGNTQGNIVTEASYPYVSGDGIVPACNMANRDFGAKISSFKNIPKNETQMAAWVMTGGPLSLAVDASTWQTYMGGVMTNCPAGQLDHGVLIVGFDDAANPPYWIIKNSWGPGWGEQGYIRVEKGTGQCSIGQYQTTSIVEKGVPTPPPGPMPTPPPGPTSAPVPPGPSGTFEQKQCTNSACTQGCQSHTFAQNTCLQLQGGGSAKAVCTATALQMTVFPFSSDCTSLSETTEQPINQCVQDESGTYFENVCNNGAATAALESKGLIVKRR